MTRLIFRNLGNRLDSCTARPSAWWVVGLLGMLAPGKVEAQVPVPAALPAVLKSLSIEELTHLQVTSVARHPEELLDSASAIQVVTGEDIRRSGATSLPEALRLADNLEVAQKNAHDWGISARGFNTDLANKLLVMVDGRTVYTPLFSGVFWDAQDYLLEDIDQIEVISGPGGTLWGANAVNGVINVTSKSAKDTQGLYWEAGAGTEVRDFTAVRYGGTLAPNVFFRVYGKYFDRRAEDLTGGTPAADSWNRGQAGFRIDAESAAQNNLTLQGDTYNGRDGVQTGGTDQASGGNLLGRWTHTFSGESDLRVQAYYDRTHLVDPIPALVLNQTLFAPAGNLTDSLDTYDLDVQHRFRADDRHRLVWGLGYRFTHDVVANAPAVAFFPPTLDHHLYSGFAQDEIAIGRDISLTLGSKLEHNDYTGTEAEPGGRLQWRPAANQTWWAAVSRAVRTPSRIDRDLSEAAPPHLVLLRGGADFQSENVVAYELGYRAQYGPKLATSYALFYNDYRDLRSTSFTPATVVPFFFANNLEGETHGLEFSGDYQVFDCWRLHAGYNFLQEHLHIKPGQTDINGALNETSDPEQQWSLRSSADLPHRVELDAGLRWVGVLHNNNGATPGTTPAYYEADVRLGWRVNTALELSVVGQNLLHDHHPEYGFPTPTRGEIKRSIYCKAAWRF